MGSASVNVTGAQPAQYSSYITGGSAEASAVVKTGAGNVIMLEGYSLSAGFVLLFDAASVPTDGTGTIIARLAVAANNNFSFNIPVCGLPTTKTGIVAVFSSTVGTKTISTASCYFQIYFT